MFITNNHTNLLITLSTDTSKTLSMTYKHLKYVDGEPVGYPTTHTVSPSTVDGKKVFTIALNQYNIGDELKEFQVSSTSDSINLWDTHEGVNVLVNGEVVNVMPVYNNSIETETIDGQTVKKQVEDLHRSKFALNFNEDGDYTIQAVYRGNNATEMSHTNPLTLHIQQPTPSGGGGSSLSGNYKLEFVNKNLKTLTYDDKTIIQFKLTRRGNPVGNKVIEMAKPNGSIASGDTSSKGIISFTNTGFNAGKYKIGARFYDQQDDDANKKTVVSVYKDIEIKKATPSFWHTSSPVNLGTKLQIKVKDSHGNNFTDKKVIVYINGSPKTTKTNDSGNVWFSFKKKGTYKIKVVSPATTNYNQITESFNFKVN